MAPDSDLWIGVYENVVSRFKGINWITYTRDDGLVLNSLSYIHSTPDGIVWIGTSGGGVSRFD